MRPETKQILNEWLYGGGSQVSSAMSTDKSVKKVDLYQGSPQADPEGDAVKQRINKKLKEKKKKEKPDKPGTTAAPDPHVAQSDVRGFGQDVR